MKIDQHHETLVKLYQIKQKTGEDGKFLPKTVDKKVDTVEISQESRKLSEYKEILQKLHEVDDKRIEMIKKAVEEGTYRVSSEDLAQALLDRMKEKE